MTDTKIYIAPTHGSSFATGYVFAISDTDIEQFNNGTRAGLAGLPVLHTITSAPLLSRDKFNSFSEMASAHNKVMADLKNELERWEQAI